MLASIANYQPEPSFNQLVSTQLEHMLVKYGEIRSSPESCWGDSKHMNETPAAGKKRRKKTSQARDVFLTPPHHTFLADVSQQQGSPIFLESPA